MVDDSLKEQTPYTPTTDEVETAFHEFASRLEATEPGSYPDAPEFANWKQAMLGFRRWLAAHEQKVRAEAWDECLDAIERYELNTEQALEGNPYTQKEATDE